MKTVKLNTGVVIEFDDKDNMIRVNSPYHINEPPTTINVLKLAVNKLLKYI